MRGKSGKPRLKRYWRESIEIPLRRDDVCGFDTALSGNGFRISVSKISEVSSIGEITGRGNQIFACVYVCIRFSILDWEK